MHEEKEAMVTDITGPAIHISHSRPYHAKLERSKEKYVNRIIWTDRFTSIHIKTRHIHVFRHSNWFGLVDLHMEFYDNIQCTQ